MEGASTTASMIFPVVASRWLIWAEMAASLMESLSRRISDTARARSFSKASISGFPVDLGFSAPGLAAWAGPGAAGSGTS